MAWLDQFWSVVVQLAGSAVGAGRTVLNFSSDFAPTDDGSRINIARAGAASTTLRARTVADSNIGSLSAASTSLNGVTLVAGDIVLLANQTTVAQNGPYVVGTVNAGVAPLTRPDWWATGSYITSGAVIEVGGEGTNWRYSSWKAMVGGGTVDAVDPIFMPRTSPSSGNMSSGSVTLTGLWILDTSRISGSLVYSGSFSSPGQLRLASATTGRGTATVTVVSSSGSDATRVSITVQNWG